MRQARELRETPPPPTASVSYKARAEGHVYFYLDRDDGGEPVPMRVDQVAVDLFRSGDGRTRQVIRGLRRQELLPIQDFRYYIDRLTAVQNGFGDRIAIGEGRDVRDVPHPLGSEGEGTYHYRIVDSLTVSAPTLPGPIKVYELEVHPRDEGVPALIGSVFVEADTGALVRMLFTFTPASYVDPRSDRITVRLEHALWEETLWLPYRQVVEVRREIPQLDLPVGSVIRATLEVTSYEFDPVMEPGFFRGPRVTMVPYGAADSTEFRAGLMDRMAEEGLSPVSMARIEAEVRRQARTRLVSGLPRLRVHADAVSSVLRANRAEGVHLGLGTSFAPRDRFRLVALAGYQSATGTLSGTLRGRLTTEDGLTTTTFDLYGRQLRDAGPRTAASGAVNTLSTLLRGVDYTDPYFASGIRLGVDREVGDGASITIGGRVEELSGATALWTRGPGSSADQRPLRPVGEGVFVGTDGALRYRWAGVPTWGAEAAAVATLGRWDGGGNLTLLARLDARFAARDLSRRVNLKAEAGRTWGALPQQMLFFVGGRGTLPGHGFRAFGGRRFVLATGEAAFALAPGWLTARLLAGAGAVGVTSDALRQDWGVTSTGGLRGYAGVGLSTLFDILRIDGAWGLPGGSFEVILSIDPRLRPYL
ncbi:MAG: hypothetical protein OXU74_12800 [Gemmatimonadota bacterium]|nr:hypothetical protein [Gemmatimonadota bacterium]